MQANQPSQPSTTCLSEPIECPFCGRKPKRFSGLVGVWIYCDGDSICPVTVQANARTLEDAILLWNARVPHGNQKEDPLR